MPREPLFQEVLARDSKVNLMVLPESWDLCLVAHGGVALFWQFFLAAKI